MLDVPECPVCLEAYDLDQRSPLTLVPCGHSICQLDFKLLQSSQCPSCKLTIKSHCKNYGLSQLLEAAATKAATSGKAATEEAGRAPPVAVKCAMHPETELTFFCEECRCLLCPKCFLESHKGHTMVGLEEAFTTVARADVEFALHLGSQAVQKTTTTLEALKGDRHRTLANRATTRAKIGARFDTMVEAVRRRRAAVLSEAESLWCVHLDRLDTEQLSAARDVSTCTQQLARLRDLHDKQDVVHLMQLSPTVTKAFRDALEQQGPSRSDCGVNRPDSLVDMVWDQAAEDGVLHAIEGLGGLMVHATSVERSTSCAIASGEGLVWAVEGSVATFRITTYSVDGCRCSVGGQRFEVTVDGHRWGSLVDVVDGGDGRHAVRYVPGGAQQADEQGEDAVEAAPGSHIADTEARHVVSDRSYGEDHSGYRRDAGGFTFVDVAVRWAATSEHVMGSPFRVRVYPAFQGIHLQCVGKRGSMPMEFHGPGTLAVDGDWLYVGDGDNHRIQVLDLSTGEFVCCYGVESGLTLKSPYGVAVDEHSIYIAERDASRVTVLEKASGRFVRSFGMQDIRDPLSVAVSDRFIAVTDTFRHRVVLYEKASGQRARAVGPAIGACGAMKCPCDVAFDSDGHLYITDRENSRILVIDPETGALARVIGSDTTFNQVNRLFVYGSRVFATDRFGNRIVVFDRHTGEFLMHFGSALFDRPNGIACWRGSVIATDFVQGRLLMFV